MRKLTLALATLALLAGSAAPALAAGTNLNTLSCKAQAAIGYQNVHGCDLT